MTRRILLGLVLVLVALTALFFAGPRVAVDTAIRFQVASLGDDVETYLENSENSVAGLREGLEKEIVWAFPQSRAKTPLSVVYIHGFSASKGEVRPLPDHVAEALGANLFFTRLTGHGRYGEAMADASVNAWVNDLAEAIAVARAIGERVIVMATSTGGGLVTWGAAQPDFMENVAGLVLISPNYRLQAQGSEILTMPWGAQIARLMAGKERGFEPRNDLHARFWTTRYPTRALLPMAALTELAREAPVESIAVPAFFILSDRDTVVDPTATRDIASRWGAAHEIVAVENSGDPSNHVIAGDALSPGTTNELAAKIVEWIEALPQ